MAQEILININVSSGKAEAGLNKTSKSVSKLEAAQNKLNYELSEEAKELAKVNALIGANRAANNAAAFASSEYGDAVKKAQKNTKNYRTQAGLNNAILLETGRLASDASFGFTAIANNLSQIVSLGGSFIATTGSIGTALGELRKSLFGVGGLLLGFQVLIGLFQSKSVQDFVKGLFGLTGRLKALSDLTKDYSTELGGTLSKFETYVAIAQDASRSEEQRAIALKKLNEEYPEYNAKLLKEGANLKDINDENERYIRLIKEKALSRAAESKLEEIAGELGLDLLNKEIELNKMQSQQATEEDYLKNLRAKKTSTANLQEMSFTQDQIAFTEKSIEKRKEAVLRIEEEVKEIKKAYDEEVKLFQEFVQLEDEEEKKRGGRTSNRFKVFKEKLLQLEKVEEGYRQRSQKADLQTNLEILAQTQQNAMAELDILEEQFLRREEARLADYKRDINGRKITDEKKRELIAQAEATFTEEVRKAGEDRAKVEEEIGNYIDSLRTLQIRKLANIAEREFDQMMNVQRAFALEATKALQTGLGDDELYFQERSKLIEENISRQEGLVNAFAEGTLDRANAERELFKLQDQLRTNDLNKEKAAIAEKQRINMQYVSFAQGIGQLLGTLAGENEALQKAAIVVEKGAAIAGVVVKAQQSIATARMQALAVPAILPPSIPNPAKPIAEADAARSIAMTKVGAAISIANILATTLTSFKKPTGAASGGSTSASPIQVQAPDFNVVGASAANQLAGAVSGQLQQPVKAFVVGKEITSQQELDREIINTAGI